MGEGPGSGAGREGGGGRHNNDGSGVSLTGELSFPVKDPVLEDKRIECEVPVLVMVGAVNVLVRVSFFVTRSLFSCSLMAEKLAVMNTAPIELDRDSAGNKICQTYVQVAFIQS